MEPLTTESASGRSGESRHQSSSALCPSRLTRWTEILLKAVSETPDPTTRFHLIANALRLELNSVAGFMTLSHVSGGPETLVMRKMAGFGEWAPAERAARDAYHADLNRYPDPFVGQYIIQGFHKKRSAVLRQEVVSDEDWYGSPHYKHLRLKAKQDSCFYVTMPAVDPRGIVLEPGLIWTINYNRSTGQDQFTTEERDFAAACFFGLTNLLYDVWRAPETPQAMILTDLPIRLRKVAGCLLAGDTEKQAAQKLGLSAHTVHGYIKDLYKAFGVNSRPELLIRLLQEDQEELSMT
jgi:DNA-binding CsgD family transcriptional regulator